MRITIDDTVVCTSVVTMDADNKGAIVIGGCINDGTDNKPIACGFVPHREEFKVEVKVDPDQGGSPATFNVYAQWVEVY